jgi:excisionase family DNA binding protein
LLTKSVTILAILSPNVADIHRLTGTYGVATVQDEMHNLVMSIHTSTPPTPLAVSLDTAAEMTSLDLRTIRRQIDAGKLRSFKVGARRLIRVTDLEAFVAESANETE